MNLKQRLAEVTNELKQLRASVETAPADQLDKLEKDISDREAEKASLERRIKMIGDVTEQPAEPAESAQARSMVTLGASGQTAEQRQAEQVKQKRAKMGEDWRVQERTVVLDSSVIIPKKQSNTLTGFPFNQVSSILDAVNYLEVINGETYEEPYVVDTGMGDYTSQASANGTGGEYHEVGIQWDNVQVTKTKITAYSEVTKELEKTPVANYADAVEANIAVSLKKKLAREIIAGDGATGHFVGLMSNAVKANTVVDFNLGAINENTLDELILNHGGDEDIESKMALVLNKLTLLAFSRVRGTADKRKVYTINYENGTIDGIKFFTTSSIKDFDTAATGDAVIAYGDLNKYRVAVFSGIETARSEHYKFRQGITAFRGDVFMGGNIMGYKAFSRVFKAASSVTKLTKKADSTGV